MKGSTFGPARLRDCGRLFPLDSTPADHDCRLAINPSSISETPPVPQVGRVVSTFISYTINEGLSGPFIALRLFLLPLQDRFGSGIRLFPTDQEAERR